MSLEEYFSVQELEKIRSIATNLRVPMEMVVCRLARWGYRHVKASDALNSENLLSAEVGQLEPADGGAEEVSGEDQASTSSAEPPTNGGQSPDEEGSSPSVDLSTSVDEAFENRVASPLKRAGFTRIDQVMVRSRSEVGDIPQIGSKSLEHIEEALGEMGVESVWESVESAPDISSEDQRNEDEKSEDEKPEGGQDEAQTGGEESGESISETTKKLERARELADDWDSDLINDGVVKRCDNAQELANLMEARISKSQPEDDPQDGDEGGSEKADEILDESNDGGESALGQMQELEATKGGLQTAMDIFRSELTDDLKSHLCQEVNIDPTESDAKQLGTRLMQDQGFSPSDTDTYQDGLDALRRNLPIQAEQKEKVFELGEKLGDETETLKFTRPRAICGRPLDDMTVAEAGQMIEELEEEQDGVEKLDNFFD